MYPQLLSSDLPRRIKLIVAITALIAGCVDGMEMGEVSQAGMKNGMKNGFFQTQGLTQYLATECPILQQRLMSTGNLTSTFPSAFTTEIGKTTCQSFMFYTVQLMVPLGEQINLYVGNKQAASFSGVMGMQYLVRQVHPEYRFAQHAFLPAYLIARKVVTQGYAALTNDIHRNVSYRTNVAAMDAHRQSVEDSWPREFLQVVPFTSAGLSAMATNPSFLALQPDFFNACDPRLINYNHLKGGVSPSAEPGSCTLPVVVHGNLPFTNDVVPGRSCRILEPGETLPAGTFLSGDVIVPVGGCPMIYYRGRTTGAIIYDDRTKNPSQTQSSDGCDVTAPSSLTNCRFNVVASGTPIPAQYLSYYVYNVEPL